MFSSNLTYFRLRRGLTKASLAEACGVTPMAVSHYEAGDRRPGMEVLQALCNALGVTLADLLRGGSEELIFEHGAFCGSAGLSKTQRDFVRASVEEYCGRLFTAATLAGGDVIPEPCPIEEVLPSDDPEENGMALREWLEIGEGPIPQLAGLLERRGFIIIPLQDCPEGFYGLSGTVCEMPYLAVNCAKTPERIRLTLSHELAHLAFSWPQELTTGRLEDAVTKAALAFLLPSEDLYAAIGYRRKRVTKDFEMTAAEYGVSMLSLVYRANDCGVVSSAAYRTFRAAVFKDGWKGEEPTRIGPEETHLLERIVCRAVCDEEIGFQRAAELMRCEYESVANLCAPYVAL